MSSAGDVRPGTYSAGVGEHETAVATAEQATEQTEPTRFNVMLRLADGERIEAGSFTAAPEAHAFAEELVATAAGGTQWPRVGDRYFRPETIISIDVEPDAQPRWTGSTGRATSWTGRNPGG